MTEAERKRDEARERFLSLKPGTKAWREAEEDLNFWQGRVAMTPNLLCTICGEPVNDGEPRKPERIEAP